MTAGKTLQNSRALSSAVWAIVALTGLYMIAAAVGALATGNLEFIFYIVVMLVLIAAVVAIHLRFQLSTWTLAALSIWGLAHMAGGLMPVPRSWPIHGDVRVLYSLWIIPDRLKYDQIVHAYGFGVTTWVCWQVMRTIIARQLKIPRDEIVPRLAMLVLCATSAMGFGALNEVIEFVATRLVPETNVGGYVNTGWDLVSNMVGAVIAALIIRVGDFFAPTD